MQYRKVSSAPIHSYVFLFHPSFLFTSFFVQTWRFAPFTRTGSLATRKLLPSLEAAIAPALSHAGFLTTALSNLHGSGISRATLGWDWKRRLALSRGQGRSAGGSFLLRRSCRTFPGKHLPPSTCKKFTTCCTSSNSLVRGNRIFEHSWTNEVFSKYLFTRLLSGGDSELSWG